MAKQVNELAEQLVHLLPPFLKCGWYQKLYCINGGLCLTLRLVGHISVDLQILRWVMLLLTEVGLCLTLLVSQGTQALCVRKAPQ